eukprot:TRINITY_DN2567_c1_g1_i3.p1 TRINITY_DN2567_c1_g1~~TRINITY_DN2567_c1_g1_i3.p1  ORF type:complete len:1447 (+),score=354.88 TRINITY_DN2567_c1_g1_i3:1597-5937(+)
MGVVTIIFSDVEDSKEQWEASPEAMMLAQEIQNRLMRDKIRETQGYEVKSDGESFMVAFSAPLAALSFCMMVQEALLGAEWPPKLLTHSASSEMISADGRVLFRGLRVRMGVHVGKPQCTPNPTVGRMDYMGAMVNKAARIAGLACGGRVLASEAFWKAVAPEVDLKTISVRHIGKYPLKGIAGEENLIELLPKTLQDRKFKPIRTGVDTATSVIKSYDDNSFVSTATEEAEASKLKGEQGAEANAPPEEQLEEPKETDVLLGKVTEKETTLEVTKTETSALLAENASLAERIQSLKKTLRYQRAGLSREQALKNEFQQEIAQRAHEKLQKNAVLSKAEDNIRSIEQYQDSMQKRLDMVVSEKETSQTVLQDFEQGFRKNTGAEDNSELQQLRTSVKQLEARLKTSRQQNQLQMEHVAKMETKLRLAEERARQREAELAQRRRERERMTNASRRSSKTSAAAGAGDGKEGAEALSWSVPEAADMSSEESDNTPTTPDSALHVTASGAAGSTAAAAAAAAFFTDTSPATGGGGGKTPVPLATKIVVAQNQRPGSAPRKAGSPRAGGSNAVSSPKSTVPATPKDSVVPATPKESVGSNPKGASSPGSSPKGTSGSPGSSPKAATANTSPKVTGTTSTAASAVAAPAASGAVTLEQDVGPDFGFVVGNGRKEVAARSAGATAGGKVHAPADSSVAACAEGRSAGAGSARTEGAPLDDTHENEKKTEPGKGLTPAAGEVLVVAGEVCAGSAGAQSASGAAADSVGGQSASGATVDSGGGNNKETTSAAGGTIGGRTNGSEGGRAESAADEASGSSDAEAATAALASRGHSPRQEAAVVADTSADSAHQPEPGVTTEENSSDGSDAQHQQSSNTQQQQQNEESHPGLRFGNVALSKQGDNRARRLSSLGNEQEIETKSNPSSGRSTTQGDVSRPESRMTALSSESHRSSSDEGSGGEFSDSLSEDELDDEVASVANSGNVVGDEMREQLHAIRKQEEGLKEEELKLKMLELENEIATAREDKDALNHQLNSLETELSTIDQQVQNMAGLVDVGELQEKEKVLELQLAKTVVERDTAAKEIENTKYIRDQELSRKKKALLLQTRQQAAELRRQQQLKSRMRSAIADGYERRVTFSLPNGTIPLTAAVAQQQPSSTPPFPGDAESGRHALARPGRVIHTLQHTPPFSRRTHGPPSTPQLQQTSSPVLQMQQSTSAFEPAVPAMPALAASPSPLLTGGLDLGAIFKVQSILSAAQVRRPNSRTGEFRWSIDHRQLSALGKMLTGNMILNNDLSNAGLPPHLIYDNDYERLLRAQEAECQAEAEAAAAVAGGTTATRGRPPTSTGGNMNMLAASSSFERLLKPPTSMGTAPHNPVTNSPNFSFSRFSGSTSLLPPSPLMGASAPPSMMQQAQTQQAQQPQHNVLTMPPNRVRVPRTSKLMLDLAGLMVTGKGVKK